MRVYAIGASRNIGYYTAIRLLEKGATVTFLLRSPSAFDSDETIQRFVQSGHARLIQGDALKSEDVARGWEAAQEGPNPHVDLVLFTLGASSASFSIIKGIVISPPDLCTRSLLNLLRTIPASHRPVDPQPRIIAITSTGVTKSSHDHLPLLWRLLYPWLLAAPHADKLGMERVLAHCAGWDWKDPEPSAEVLPPDWKTVEGTPGEGELKRILVVRPALLTNGECRASVNPATGGKDPYKVSENDSEDNGYIVSRKDVAHFIVEGALEDWERWEGKCMSIAY